MLEPVVAKVWFNSLWDDVKISMLFNLPRTEPLSVSNDDMRGFIDWVYELNTKRIEPDSVDKRSNLLVCVEFTVSFDWVYELNIVLIEPLSDSKLCTLKSVDDV